MSKYTMYYNSRQTMYRDFANNWAKFASNNELSDRQYKGMALFFKPIARRFGLIEEFRTLGII